MPRVGNSLSIHFSDGTPCVAWTRASVRESFIDPLNAYSFRVEPPQGQLALYRAKLKRGEPISIRVDGNPLASPLIQTVTTTIGSGGSALDVDCASALCTPYDGSCDPEYTRSWDNDVSVDEVVLGILSLYGFDGLQGDASAHVNALTGKGIKGRAAALNIRALKLRDIQAQEGEAAYQICSRIFNRLGGALHVDYTGELLLRKPDYDQQAAYSLVQDADQSTPGNRFLSDPGITLRQSNEGLYSEVVVRGASVDGKGKTQTGQPMARVAVEGATRPTDAPFAKAVSTTVPAGNSAYSSTTAPYKPRYVLDKDCRDDERCRNAATLIHGSRAAQAYWLQGTVDGLVSHTGRVWAPDTVARVYVAALDMDEEMWILDRSFEVDDKGERTSLRLIEKGALTLGI